MNNKIKNVGLVGVLALALAFSGCAGTGASGVGGTPTSGTRLTGTVQIPGSATYAKTVGEKVLFAFNYVIGSVAEALTGQTPWAGATVELFTHGDYIGELLQLGTYSAVTDANGQYDLPDAPQQFVVVRVQKNGANLYSFNYPGSSISGDITAESAAAMHLLTGLIHFIDYSKISVSDLNSLKTQLENSLSVSFNANPSLVPDFSNATSVKNFTTSFLTNGFLTSGANWTAFQNALSNYYSNVPGFQVPSTSITSFGSGISASWSSVPTFKTLRSGNARQSLAGSDLLEVKLSKDATYFYIYAKTNGAPSTVVANQYLLHVGFGQFVSNNNISYGLQYNGSAWVANGGYGSTNFENYVGSDYVELRIPLTSISAIAVPGNQLFFQLNVADMNNVSSINTINFDSSDSAFGLFKF